MHYDNNCLAKKGQTSEDWGNGFLDIRKSKIISFINKRRLHSTGFLERINTNAEVCDAGCGDLSLLGQLKGLGYQNLYGFDIDADLINLSSKNSLSEKDLLKDFSINRKVVREIISKKYHQIHSKWHTGFWIFGGIRE